MKRSAQSHRCGVSAALDVVGDRWALLVVRELLFSPKRFGDLVRGLPGIGTNTLTTRLGELEEAGVLEKRASPPPLSLTAYALTDRGRALTPVLIGLARWGSRRLLESDSLHPMQPAWLGLAMLAYFDADAAPRRPVRVGLVFPDGGLTVEVGERKLQITEGPVGAVEVTLIADHEELVLDMLRGIVTLAQAKKKKLRIDGDTRAVAPFLASFPL